MNDDVVQGTCDPKFEAVKREFARNFAERDEVGASVYVTLDGSPVVDLWGGKFTEHGERAWEADTRVVVFSNSKGATALCAHVLVDRGELDLDAPVRKYWPEFATNGEEDVTVAMMLSHQAGVAAVSAELKPGDMYDWELMCDVLAKQEPFWKPGTRNGYHMVTFGWVVGELIRRVSGQSLGSFLRSEITGPRDLDIDLGLPDHLEPTVAPIILWVPAPEYDSDFTRAIVGEPHSVTSLSMANQIAAGLDFNSRAFHAAEIGGAGVVASARGLGGMYTPLANDGGDLVGHDTLTRMSEVAVATSYDLTLRIPSRFSLGFMKSMDNRRTVTAAGMTVLMSAPAFGHVGAGGSLGFADPVERIGFGYVMNRQGVGVLVTERAQTLVDSLYQSLGYRTNAHGVWSR